MSEFQSRAILDRLVAFPTVSRQSNAALIAAVRGWLEPLGARINEVPSAEGRSNLWISIGPEDRPGIVLSGHSDVVPVEGQNWTRDPFRLSEAEGRLYGRGTADMKGFLASAIAMAAEACRRDLATPLHLALSCDEEIGCIGVRSLLPVLEALPLRPLLVWIGEPTGLRLATGHKGKAAWRATARGREAHSALAPTGLNAIHLIADFIAALRHLQQDLIERGASDPDYDVPYSTIHVGTIGGGTALNIVPNACTIDYEIRCLGQDDPQAIEAAIAAAAEAVVAPCRARFPEAAITLEAVNAYPGLDTRHAGAIAFMDSLTRSNEPAMKVAFGTEGGLFAQTLGVPTVICGPGSMDQGHKADEFVTLAQLERCDALLARLLDRLEAGLAQL